VPPCLCGEITRPPAEFFAPEKVYIFPGELFVHTNAMVRVICLAVLAAAALVSTPAADGEAQFLQNIRQLTFEGKTGEGYFSPDGKDLIFQSVREPGNPFYQMYILSFETGDTHRVSPGLGKTTCGFFRPGTDQVLFASTHHDPDAKKKQEDELAFIASGKTRRYSWDYDPQMDIFSAKRDGSNLKRLTDSPGYDAEAAYSPNGSKIVFSSIRNAFPVEKLSPIGKKRYETDPAYFAEIYLMNADGSAQTRLTRHAGYDGGPFFMPDGERILWRRFDTNGMIADVFSMKLDGSDVRQITRFQSMSWAPYPHPSGKYIVFTSNKHGFENFELFIVDTHGRSEPVRVSFTDGFDGLPVFSPDGKKLCWTSNRTGSQSQLHLADWNHEAALAALKIDPNEIAAAESPETPSPAPAPLLSPEIKADDIRTHVEYLASDALEGRKTGEPGARKAAEYLAAQLESLGLDPLTRSISAAAKSFYDPFEFTAGVKVKKEQTSLSLKITNSTPVQFTPEKDFIPFSFSSDGKFEGPVVFAGYGLSIPGKQGEGYDSYAGLDVTNKVVLVLRYVPEDVSPARRQQLNRYAALQYKAMIARERGAKAILVVSGPNSPTHGQLYPLSFDGGMHGSEILAASITADAAEKILSPSGKSLKDLQTALDQENPHAETIHTLTNVTLSLSVGLERSKKTDRNVVGIIPGATPEYVMVGAHYDHLGLGEEGGSREHAGEKGQVHNGADDNASGVAAVLELAAKIKTDQQFLPLSPKPKRGLIVAFWSGEEMGLLGSSHFAERSPIPLTNIVAYLNFDMVGRLRTNKLALQGVGSSTAWPKLIERRNVVGGFNINLTEDPYLPTDTTAFYPKGIPVLAFFTGSHDDYHRPTDDSNTLDYDGAQRISRFAQLIVQDLMQAEARPDYVKVERSSSGGARDSLRAYLGTVPDYATEVKGVKLSGVKGGSPAEKGGIKPGDVIVEFAGQKIANIYDYTYALDAVKIGQPVKIKVLRQEKPVEITVTPEPRK
jgi:Tol biopolymer transport system component